MTDTNPTSYRQIVEDIPGYGTVLGANHQTRDQLEQKSRDRLTGYIAERDQLDKEIGTLKGLLGDKEYARRNVNWYAETEERVLGIDKRTKRPDTTKTGPGK